MKVKRKTNYRLQSWSELIFYGIRVLSMKLITAFCFRYPAYFLLLA
ncbi:hypothetical protein NC653_017844 [Populus alba x Populus x berolinensis]|uniref:Uncharacterized protein n=1 Tax=Populus alba x Populus x berolinensis TaxID=444605 RepID=A0AAD6QS29_9ROSI|nr:hypothetical protein NC653_017844 [Populus alba x Populus x berolinensis]